MRDIIDKLSARPVFMAVMVLAVVVAVVVAVSMSHGKYGKDDFLEGIIVEAHGLLLELAVLGVFIVWLNKRGQVVRDRLSLHDEIEMYRYWISEESMHRTVGCIRILNKMGVSVFDLRSCKHLKRANLYCADLSGSFLNGANLLGANFAKVKLNGADLTGVNMREASYLTKEQLLSAQCLHNAQLDSELENEVKQNKPILFQSSQSEGTVILDRSVGRIRVLR